MKNKILNIDTKFTRIFFNLAIVILLPLNTQNSFSQKKAETHFSIHQKLEFIDIMGNKEEFQFFNKIAKREQRRSGYLKNSKTAKINTAKKKLIKRINYFEDSLGFSVALTTEPFQYNVIKKDSVVSVIRRVELVYNQKKDNVLLLGIDTTERKQLMFAFGKKMQVEPNDSYVINEKYIYTIRTEINNEQYNSDCDSFIVTKNILQLNIENSANPLVNMDTIYKFSYTMHKIPAGLSIPVFHGQERTKEFYIHNNNFVYQVESLFPRKNIVFINGINLNKKYNYDRIINYCYINEKPAFLFIKEEYGSNLELSYNNKNYKTLKYNELYWMRSGFHNMKLKKGDMIFHARKKNRYFTVEIK